uniref:Uncharacterized protein n=1 Tax=Tetranychus urticae TaxID=32264 RepID=T1KL36_TETUR
MNTNFEARFMVALKRANLVEKCQELSLLIQESLSENYKLDIQNCFPSIVENLFAFGYQNDSNINLRFISSQTHQAEFHSLLNLMHPEGPLFQWIRYLMKDQLAGFYFPVSCLPLPSRCLIEEGLPSEFYLNRLVSDGTSVVPNRVSLNAFEFFLFHLAHYVHSSKVMQNLDNGNPANILYITLIEMYLNYFVPLESSAAKSSSSSTMPDF